MSTNEFDDFDDGFDDEEFTAFLRGEVDVQQLPNPIPHGFFDDVINWD